MLRIKLKCKNLVPLNPLELTEKHAGTKVICVKKDFSRKEREEVKLNIGKIYTLVCVNSTMTNLWEGIMCVALDEDGYWRPAECFMMYEEI